MPYYTYKTTQSNTRDACIDQDKKKFQKQQFSAELFNIFDMLNTYYSGINVRVDCFKKIEGTF